MTREYLFQKFELLSEEPGAIAKIRELILRLAFSGALSGYGTSQPTELPGWEARTIDSICSSITPGFACSKDHQVEGGHVHLRTHNISTLGSLNFDLLVRIDPNKVDATKAAICRGDILFNNTNSQELVGKTSLVDRDYPYSFSNHITRLRVQEDVDPAFVAFYLTLLRNSGYFASICTRWINQAAVNTETLRRQSILLPPIAEQKRIVAKVDELMALCDRLETQQKERETRHAVLARASLARFTDAPTPANLTFLFHKSYAVPPADLRKCVLRLAVQGMLVRQDLSEGCADKLLALISNDAAKAVRAKRMRRVKPIPTYEGELSFHIPAAWRWAPLGSLTAPEDSAMCDGPFGSKLKTEHYVEASEYKVLRLGNIGPGYFIHGKEGHISREHFESLSGNHTAPGDLLVAGLAEPLVRCCEIPPDLGAAVNKADCFRVRLSKHLERSYIRHYLNSPIAKAFAAEENHGMTRERINLANAKALPVPVPPLAEQRRIVAKVDQLMALVDELEAQLAASRATATRLLDAIVGELTA